LSLQVVIRGKDEMRVNVSKILKYEWLAVEWQWHFERIIVQEEICNEESSR